MKYKPANLLPIDVTDLIQVLCNLRAEHFEFERHVALRTFSAWISWPTEPEVINQAWIVSAGLVLRMILKNDLPLASSRKAHCVADLKERAMRSADLAETLTNAPLKDRFCVAIEEMFGPTDVAQAVEFLLRCPAELKPSLNKAIYFMKEGGFPLKCSPATLKTSWNKYLPSAPFKFVEFPDHRFQPDDTRYTDESVVLLNDETRLRRYFAEAKFVQEQLMDRLDNITLSRFTFVDFPAGIASAPIEIEPYPPQKIALIKSYRAPTAF